MNPLLAHMEREAGLFRSAVVVELGAALGIASAPHLEEVESLTIVEPSDAVIENLSAGLPPGALGFRIRKGEISHLAFIPMDSVDICLCALGTSTSADSEQLFRQIGRIIRPEGVFVFAMAHPLITLRAFSRLPADHSYFESVIIDPSILELGFEVHGRLLIKPISKVAKELKRAGLVIDALAEVSVQEGEYASTPDFWVIRCRKG